jgi:glycosyltransferase involved in cell wall biosynthesis
MEDNSNTDHKPLVSVIIPAFKVAPFIRETLDSVLGQTFTDHEVIVINDGSPDTDELESALQQYLDRIVYLKQGNQGAGAARNAGLRRATGEFVAFLDGDDVWLPCFLRDQLHLIESDNGYDLVYADAINIGDPSSEGSTSMSTNPSRGAVTFEALITGQCSVLTSAVLARRKLIMDVGLFDEGLPNSQDFDLWLRLVRDANARVTYQRKVLVRRRIYPGSLAADPKKSLAGELKVLEKTSLRSDLTSAEKATIERIAAVRRGTIELARGKDELASEDFAAAIASFERANRYLHSRKLGMVLLGLRIAPRTIRRIHSWRPT